MKNNYFTSILLSVIMAQTLLALEARPTSILPSRLTLICDREFEAGMTANQTIPNGSASKSTQKLRGKTVSALARDGKYSQSVQAEFNQYIEALLKELPEINIMSVVEGVFQESLQTAIEDQTNYYNFMREQEDFAGVIKELEKGMDDLSDQTPEKCKEYKASLDQMANELERMNNWIDGKRNLINAIKELRNGMDKENAQSLEGNKEYKTLLTKTIKAYERYYNRGKLELKQKQNTTEGLKASRVTIIRMMLSDANSKKKKMSGTGGN